MLSAEVGALQLGAFRFFQGIEMKFKNQLFPMIICPAWIPELNAVEHGPEGKGGPCLSPPRGGHPGGGLCRGWW